MNIGDMVTVSFIGRVVEISIVNYGAGDVLRYRVVKENGSPKPNNNAYVGHEDITEDK